MGSSIVLGTCSKGNSLINDNYEDSTVLVRKERHREREREGREGVERGG